MDFLSIITAKKNGQELTAGQIRSFAQAASDGSVPDYQLAALLMAIRLNGMTARETNELTLAMAQSGDMLDPDVGGVPVDKHSTGGVGDTTTLVLAPLVAACGGKVLKMSGRGLGHTGGTIDKLESIPGMRVSLPEDEFVDIVRRVGCAVVGQSKELAPADKRLYALRDVTSTVDSIPLIASSILSKKFAAGAKAIVLDVKFGSGAIMDTMEKTLDLARAMVSIGALAGRQVTAVISSMEEPLGTHIGNALEVKEAIDILSGRAGGDLKEVSLFLGTQMLVASKVCPDEETALARLNDALVSGRGLAKLKEMIRAQGGDPAVCDDVNRLPQAPVKKTLLCGESGYVCGMNTMALGSAAQAMGAGRLQVGDTIDYAVGFVLRVRLGDRVEPDMPLCELHARTEEDAERAEAAIRRAIHFCAVPCERGRNFYALVSAAGVEML